MTDMNHDEVMRDLGQVHRADAYGLLALVLDGMPACDLDDYIQGHDDAAGLAVAILLAAASLTATTAAVRSDDAGFCEQLEQAVEWCRGSALMFAGLEASR